MTHRVLAGAAALLGVLAVFAGTPHPAKLDVSALAAEIVAEEDHVTAIELAQWIRDRKAGLRIFDLRPVEEFDEYHVPSAKHVALDALVSMRFTPADTIVLVSDGGAHAAQAWVLLRASGTAHVYFLRGGLGEWLDDVMNPVGAPAEVVALSRYFGGMPRSGTPSTTTTNTVRDMKRRGC